MKQNDQLDQLQRLVERWNPRINLVSRADVADLRQRHIEDSAQLLPLLPAGDGPAADLGSGAGFPGLVLAILTTRPWHLVEVDRRKAAFLATAAGELGLDHVRIHVARIEDVVLPPLAVVTARALAPLPELLAHAARLLAPEGVALFPKGRSVQDELTAARAGWHMTAEEFPSRTNGASTILRISGIRRAGP
ncbi:16S rRNA (guanine(527)-N(7))-methyltransferase RsmG [Humitalea rosea]|uniref:16S rRNA (guanine(527)-N(7))-methyltransferase RsmG n=1 Tax=Humitalea rosea TaxID=990373 RepID=UPI001FE775B8|nr:16S rRNA (guanine(527)-N(7))-methyltransferase RsmG [Humitalea rosea]